MSFYIIGDADTVLGFAFSGVPGTSVESADDARTAFSSATSRDDVQIMVLTEKVAEWVEAELTEHRLSTKPPYVVEVPDIWGTPVERSTLEELIQEAVGIRIAKDTSSEDQQANGQKA